MTRTAYNGSDQSLYWKAIRFAFRLLYNEMAWTYDWVSWVVSLGEWRNWQRVAIPHLDVGPGSLVLELAHGTGNLQLDMLADGLRPIGYDLSRHMGRISSRKMRRTGQTGELVRGLAQQLPFPDERFDALVSTFPTEFIIAQETLLESARVLKPGGNLVIVPNGQLIATNVGARILEWLYKVTGQREPFPVEFSEACSQAGFQARTIEESVGHSRAWVVIAEKPAAW